MRRVPCLRPSSKSAFALISPDELFSCCDLVIGSERPSHAQQEVLSRLRILVQDASWATQCISDTAEFLRKTLSWRNCADYALPVTFFENH